MFELSFKNRFYILALGLLLARFDASAGEVDLPQITEVPDLKRETLLKDIDIPSVRERDPDPNAGPRLSVTEFRLQGIVEYPELGITRAEISKIVEDIRFDMMGEGKLLESGYTLDELGELSNLLVNIEKDVQGRHVGALEVQRLVWLVRDQQLKRGITLGMIETVADRITTYYREHGFILAKAYIPEQQVRDGVVNLTLLLGVLGETKVNDSELYDDEIISSVFDDMMTKPVTSAVVEEKLYLINDLPGLSTQGFFEAGSQVGDTRLNINVKNQNSFVTNFRVDNHGTEETGENRLYSEFFWNNMTGTADQLQVAVLGATSPANTAYGQVRYNTNYFGPRFKISLGYAQNAFVLGRGSSEAINALNLEGDTTINDISFSYKHKRSRVENYSYSLSYENVDSRIRLTSFVNDGGRILDDEVNNAVISFNYDILQETNKMLHKGNVRLTQGEFVFGKQENQDENFTILNSEYSLLSFWNFPFTDVETRSIVRGALQYSESSLSSINQFSLGGPSRTRGFEAKEFSADQAIYLGADLFFNLPEFLDVEMGSTSLANVISPFVFMDAGFGRSYTTTDDGSFFESTLVNLGVGLQFSYSDNMSGTLQFAYPVENKYSSPTTDGIVDTEDDFDKDVKILFDFQYIL
ncbi:ShlB/FhaC/HecB family hemolysin secretion/activation protein [Aliikangiella marina]|nr:ShlB/FhaC/HecB family hemolysin secretion/activation protein [Aliikangiella marina]